MDAPPHSRTRTHVCRIGTRGTEDTDQPLICCCSCRGSSQKNCFALTKVSLALKPDRYTCKLQARRRKARRRSKTINRKTTCISVTAFRLRQSSPLPRANVLDCIGPTSARGALPRWPRFRFLCLLSLVVRIVSPPGVAARAASAAPMGGRCVCPSRLSACMTTN